MPDDLDLELAKTHRRNSAVDEATSVPAFVDANNLRRDRGSPALACGIDRRYA